MSDLMGHWVPREQIESVLDVCRRAHWHQFQLLTKNPQRLKDFSFPQNIWIGVSAPPTSMMGKTLTFTQQKQMVKVMLKALHQVDAQIKWMSIEPLSFDIAPLLVDSKLEWAVIGAATNGVATYQPKPEWVQNALTVLDQQGTSIFFKGNLVWDNWREDFPTVNQTLEASVPALF